MNSNSDLVNLPFDLYIRNLLIKRLINSVRKNNNESLKILDVGGRAGKLCDFLPDDDMHILDIRSGEESNYVVGNVSHTPYKDASFDVVVSSDVYEHIPPEDRLNAVNEMLRISKNYVILGAPFYSKEVADAEIKACKYFYDIVGEPHPWLKEHIENGLPSKDELEEFLQSNGIEFLINETNNISNWLLFQLFIFYAYKYGISPENVSKVYRYYNENFMYLGDSLEPSYRKIYLIGKRGTLPKIDLRYSCKVEVKYHTFEALMFEAVGKLADSKDTHIHNLESVINENNKQIALCIETIQNKDTHIQNLESIINEKDKQIALHIETIQNKENQIAESNRILNDVQSSTTWELLTKYQSIVDRLLPASTKRRGKYDLGIIGLRILVKDGHRALLYKMRERRRQKHFRIPKIPIVETSNFSPMALLSLGKALRGQFTFTANSLNEIRFLTATYKRQNSDVELQIMNSDGYVLRKGKIKGYKVLDNDYTSFRFRPIKDSKGQTFSFKIVSKGEPSAAVWYNEIKTIHGLDLNYDNEPVQGIIGFQAFANIATKNLYELWILKNEPTKADLKQYKKEIQNFNYQPKISIVTPVYNPDVAWIKAAIESVINQVYQKWELCLADASTKEDVKKCLKTYSEKDPRIKVLFLPDNKGISGNSNEALSLATGEYIGLLDHDDELSPDALYEVVKYLQVNPDADMIYSDEDKIDLEGHRSDPFFKPDWSPDMFLSCMYTCHLGIYRKKIIDDLRGFREGYDGSQDYDLVLRVIEKTDSIHHIAKVLYHWRTVPGSTAAKGEYKSYAFVAAKKALSDFINRKCIKGQVIDGVWTGSYHINRDLLGNSLISIIIPTKDNVKVLKKCIDSIFKYTKYNNYEIIIVNNNSTENSTYDYFEIIKKMNNIEILDYEKDFNFSAINNFAVEKAKGDYILFLNNDTEIISENWLDSLLKQAQRKEVGAVGCKLLYPNETIQHAGLVLGMGMHKIAGQPHQHFPRSSYGYMGRVAIIHDVSAVTAACIMMRKEVFEEVGGFDEINLAVAYNDIDLCLRLKQLGYLIVYTPYAELYHHESLSRGFEDSPEKQARFLSEARYIREKWGNLIDEGDPYYSKNLTLEKGDFSIRI